MKWQDKVKFKVSQSTYKNKLFERFPNQVSDMMDEVEEFIEKNLAEQEEKTERVKKSKKRRRY